MPIYEYICESCEERCEVLQKISDPGPGHCPACGHDTLRKIISATGFRLSGSGWYETDFKTGNQRNLDSYDKPNDNKKKSDTAGDNKAEASRPVADTGSGGKDKSAKSSADTGSSSSTPGGKTDASS